jgi:DNA-binding transcriptional LysR family regulator
MPTAEADLLYPRTLQLLDDLGTIREEITAAGTGVKGKLIIGASTIPGTYILPRKAYSFKKQYPEVAFEILIEDSAKITDMVLQHDLPCGIVGARMSSDKLVEILIEDSAKITDMVLKHDLPCGIVGARMSSDKLVYKPLFEDELVLVATKKVLALTLKKLASIPFLQREIGSGTRQTFENFLEKTGTTTDDFNIVATLGSTSAVRQAVKESLGASVISRIAVQEELGHKKLQEITIRNLRMKRKFYLVRQKKRTLPSQYAAFFSHLKKT